MHPDVETRHPENVRRRLLAAPAEDVLRPFERRRSLTTFCLRLPSLIAGRWQGGTFLRVKRVSLDAFSVGALPLMHLEAAARYVERCLEAYGMPYLADDGEDPKHPFDFVI